MKLNKIHEVLNSANSLFLVTLTVCCHPESLLPWERDVMTSPLYWWLWDKGLTCEEALQGVWERGWEKEGELATTSVEFEFHLQFPCGSPSTELSDFPQSALSGNERECKQTKKTRAKGNDVISYVISANEHFASTFSMQIKYSRNVVPSSPSFSRPAARAPRRACSHELFVICILIGGQFTIIPK